MRKLAKYGPLALLFLCVWQIAHAARQSPQLVARWDAPPDLGLPLHLVGYKVHRRSPSDPIPIEDIWQVSGTKFVDTSVQPGVLYLYSVSAVYAEGVESAETPLKPGIFPGGGGCN